MAEVPEKQPLISIVTIVLNGEKHLARCMESVFSQSFKDFEYLVIDGGSTDSSPEIIRSYQSRLAFFTSEKDKGISDAFNKGISRCRGQIIGLLNADDFYEPDCLERVAANAGKADVIYGNLTYWKGSEKLHTSHADHRRLHREMTINHPACFIQSDAYARFGLYREDFRYAMDYELLLRFKKQGARFLYLPEVFTHMQVAGISDRYFVRGIYEVKRAKDIHGARQWQSSIYFCKQWVAITFARLLPKVGLRRLLQFYRARFSSIKKLN